ncbi:agamous-like MADS-box protein AGL80 [Impatiens glandulifera]|uniref:agamous-like MADS-box protein AGL80 n=1 Tax=Impatiens glandulifera TaxID=253017 RepID=UPI001FB0502B|nr:agamous-like MADS-box protein AGL80 [Impatiens glandulifera]
MRRGKVKIAFIQNDIARKTALTNRANAISKKSSELEILCGVSIVYAFFNINDAEPSEAFPSLNAVKDFMSHVMNLSLLERTQKATTQDVYLFERITKESSELQNLREKNNHSEGLEFLCKVFEGSIDFNQIEERILNCMNQVILEKFQEIENRKQSQYMNNPPNDNGDDPNDDAQLQVLDDHGNIVPHFHSPPDHFVNVNSNFVPYLPSNHFIDDIANIVHYPSLPQPTIDHYPLEPQHGRSNLNNMVHLPWLMQSTLMNQYESLEARPSNYSGSSSAIPSRRG